MAERGDDTLARITRNQTAGTSDFTYSTVEEALKSPRGVLVLGQMIVGHLELDARGALLERWLAHDLADAMAVVRRRAGPARTAAQARVVDCVSRLNTRLAGPANVMAAASRGGDVTRATERRSLFEVLKELECLPVGEELPEVDDSLPASDEDPPASQE